MSGTLTHYIFADDRDQFLMAAHHEVAHALRGHSLGVTVGGVYLSPYQFGGYTCVKFTSQTGGPNDFPCATHVQIALAGPATTLRFLGDNKIRVLSRDRGVVFGRQEDDADLVRVIQSLTWDHKGKLIPFDKLVPEIFPDCRIVSPTRLDNDVDDFDRAFDSLIMAHYNRYYRLPRITTLLRQYRKQEQIITTWVDDHWGLICDLAELLLTSEKPTRRYSHCLTGPKFRKFIRRVR